VNDTEVDGPRFFAGGADFKIKEIETFKIVD
jgi:hypothetical protein